MASNKEKELAFERFNKTVAERINNNYGNLVQTINEALTRILQSTLLSAESFEEFFKAQLSELFKIIFQSGNDNHPKTLKEQDSSVTTHEGAAFNSDVGSTFECKEEKDKNEYPSNISCRQKVKVEGKSFLENIERVGSHFQCSECVYSTARKEHLIQHLKSIHKYVFDYECNLCGNSFVRDCDLSKHMRTKHNK